MSRLGPYELDSIVVGDCLDVMAAMPKNCVDTIITDPPYGLEFMGKEWDKLLDKRGNRLGDSNSKGQTVMPHSNAPTYRAGTDAQQWHEAWTTAALRVAKPGAMLMAFGGTRTHHRLMCAIEDAGWEIRDCIMWVYGSGFPKSHDISKAIDKAAGAEREMVGRRQFADGSSGRETGGDFDGNPSKSIERTHLTSPATPAAQLWDGWGTALKPAYEIIIVAMKPRDGTFANNALKWGVAGLWVDGGRVGFSNEISPTAKRREAGYTPNREKARDSEARGALRDRTDAAKKAAPHPADSLGRWPANLIHDGSEEVVRGFPNSKSDGGTGATTQSIGGRGAYQGGDNRGFFHFADNGSAARFFYCAKASRAERDAGLDELPDSVLARSCQAIAEAKRGNTVEREGGAFNKARVVKNNHPTVKPLALMEYLCRLTKTPTGGVVFDPFAGSGTTLLAARIQGRHYFGCDISEEYVEIARQRLRAVQPRLI